ncbi:hypothetical protein PGB90_009817 [Kerria lacca]
MFISSNIDISCFIMYLIFRPGQVSLLPNVTYGKTENELKGISVAASLAGEESADNSNMLTITGEDGLVYQVDKFQFFYM